MPRALLAAILRRIDRLRGPPVRRPDRSGPWGGRSRGENHAPKVARARREAPGQASGERFRIAHAALVTAPWRAFRLDGRCPSRSTVEPGNGGYLGDQLRVGPKGMGIMMMHEVRGAQLAQRAGVWSDTLIASLPFDIRWTSREMLRSCWPERSARGSTTSQCRGSLPASISAIPWRSEGGSGSPRRRRSGSVLTAVKVPRRSILMPASSARCSPWGGEPRRSEPL